MCTLYINCFFCGKDVLQIVKKETDIITESVRSFDNDNSSIFTEVVHKSIRQISNYLQIAKSEIPNKLDNGAFKISICPSCWLISENLSKLCGELEVIQMKIKYFLNLLTDQILTNDQSHTISGAAVQVNESSFQETFHQKCLSKLANFQINPKLRITKCQTPMQPSYEDAFVGSDDFGDDDVGFGEDSDSNSVLCEDSSKPLTNLETVSHFKCTHCPLTLANRYNLEKHMRATHGNNKSRNGHNIKTCKYCGAMIRSNNLGTHIKTVHGIGRTLPANLEIKKMKRCETCRKLISIKNVSKHRKLCRLRGKQVIKKDLKHDGEDDIETYLVKKVFQCTNCNKWFERRTSLISHLSKNEICRRHEKNIMEMKSERIIKCPNNCGGSFTTENILKRHLKRTCKMNGVMENSNKIEMRISCDSEMGKHEDNDNIKEEIIDI